MNVGEDSLTFATDAAAIDVDAVHRYLSEESYWARGIPRSLVERSIRYSICIGVFDGAAQVGFSRVVTDRATFGYLCDVYVLATHRGRGIGRRMIEALLAHPELQGLRRWNLVTRDAHALYAPFGFRAPDRPEGYMELLDRGVYERGEKLES